MRANVLRDAWITNAFVGYWIKRVRYYVITAHRVTIRWRSDLIQVRNLEFSLLYTKKNNNYVKNYVFMMLPPSPSCCLIFFQTCAKMFQICFYNFKIYILAVGIVFKFGGPISRSIVYIVRFSSTYTNILQIVWNNLEIHFRICKSLVFMQFFILVVGDQLTQLSLEFWIRSQEK